MGLHRSVLSEWGSLEKSLLEVSNIVQQVPQSLVSEHPPKYTGSEVWVLPLLCNS